MANGRVCVVAIIAFWELLASGLSSVAMSQAWFEPYTRGLFILILATSTILVRIFQITYYKCKLDHIIPKIEREVIKETEYKKQQTKKSIEMHDPGKNSSKSPNETKKEDEASEITNYRFALYFIAYSTFSDASFDIIQAIVLVLVFSSVTQPLAVVGSLVGFATEVLDFFEEIFGFACDMCKDMSEFGPLLEKTWCFTVIIGCIIEQGL
eukprot:146575_1